MLLLNDLDGSEADETVRFGLNGTSYETSPGPEDSQVCF
jgi:hypothetical protein